MKLRYNIDFTESRLIYNQFGPRENLSQTIEQTRVGPDDTPQTEFMEGAKARRDQLLAWEQAHPDLREEIQQARHGLENTAVEFERQRQEIQRETETAGKSVILGDGMIRLENGSPVVGDISTSEIAQDSDGFVDFWRNLTEQEKREIFAPLVGMIPLSGTAEALYGTSFTGEELTLLDKAFTIGLDIGGKPLKILGGPALFAFGIMRFWRKKGGKAMKKAPDRQPPTRERLDPKSKEYGKIKLGHIDQALEMVGKGMDEFRELADKYAEAVKIGQGNKFITPLQNKFKHTVDKMHNTFGEFDGVIETKHYLDRYFFEQMLDRFDKLDRTYYSEIMTYLHSSGTDFRIKRFGRGYEGYKALVKKRDELRVKW